MSSLVALLPEEQLGVVVLTNMNASLLPSVMVHRMFDDLLVASTHELQRTLRLTARSTLIA